MEGIWEHGPDEDETCASCGKPVTLDRGQFLGLSNGDWAWCCNLTCLIAEAERERELFTDNVGPPMQVPSS
jgi:hypothetical protein